MEDYLISDKATNYSRHVLRLYRHQYLYFIPTTALIYKKKLFRTTFLLTYIACSWLCVCAFAAPHQFLAT